MLTFALRRGAFISHKVLNSVCSSQRCWTSTLPLLSTPGYTSLSLFSAAGPSFLLSRPASRSPSFLTCTQPIHTSSVRLKKRPTPEPPPQEPKTPKPALYLGYSSVLPFACPTLFMAFNESFIPELAYAQVAYGASFLSFLGGAKWGFALPPSSPAEPDWMNLANSLVPSLMAWAAMLMSDTIVSGINMVIIGLGIALHNDLSLLPTYPTWFKKQRFIVTFVAILTLIGTLVIYGNYPEKKLFSEENDE